MAMAGVAPKKKKQPVKTLKPQNPVDPYFGIKGSEGPGTPKGATVAKKPETTLGGPPNFGVNSNAAANTAPPVTQAPAPLDLGNQFGMASAPPNPSAGSNFGSGGTDPVGGFAARYPAGQLMTLFQQPGIVGEDVLGHMGLGVNDQMLGQYGYAMQFAPAIAELLGARTNNTSLEGGVNTMADYARNLGTPGGRLPDQRELLPGILDPSKGSDIYDLLNAVDPNTGLPITAAEQMSLMQPYIQAATSATTPLHQRAIDSALDRELANFQAKVARGQSPGGTSFYNYLFRNNLIG